MAITENQRNNIHKLSFTDAIEVFNELIEHLGIVSQKEYVKIMGYTKTRQNLREDMIKGKIKSVKIGHTRYPVINE